MRNIKKSIPWLVIALTLIGITLTMSATADTPTYELNFSTGIWISTEGGGDTVTGVGTNEVRWGYPTIDDNKSGLRFDGVGTTTFNEGDIFTLGTLTHLNWPVYSPAATGATLQITIEFNVPDVDPNPEFTFDFAIDETPNEDDEDDCAAWHTPGKPPCDDMITFPNQYGQESFTIEDKLYTLKIEGFVDSQGNTVSQFITHEKEDNAAILKASLSSVLVPRPDITLTKKTNDIDVSAAPGPNLYVGETVTWSYIVQNTGNVALSAISLVDDIEGTITCPETTLAAGDLMTCTATGTVSVGQYINEATVTGTPSEGSDVNDTDTSYYFGIDPSIRLVKTSNVSTFSTVGETITYTFTVENTGNTNLTNVVINDPLTGSVDLAVTPSTLAPTQTGTATATYLTTQVDIDAGQILNIEVDPKN
jgi:uncharacterized repeat protein (TIGR01451 family)